MKFKRLVAVVLTATMILGGTVAVAADDRSHPTTVTVSGNGANTGHTDRTIVNCVFPTIDNSNEEYFNYTMDPEGLIAESGMYKANNITFKKATASANNVYFNTATNEYDSTSLSYNVINKSSVSLNIIAEASVVSADKVTLVEKDEVSGEGTGVNLYLGIAVGDDVQAIKSTGATAKAEVAGNIDNFELTSEADGTFGFDYKSGKLASNSTDDWANTTIYMEGACNKVEDASSTGTYAPKVTVTWKYEQVGATGSPSTTKTTYKKSETTADINVVFDYGNATAITGVKYSADGSTWSTYGNPANFYAINNASKTLTAKKSFVTGLTATRYWRVYFDNSETVYVDLTFTAD